jgi:2',3'-cyclic-nucleotide 2'-phosphodiesterase/3'-nucleotidase
MTDLLAYYIINGLNGTIVPDYSQNWKLIGIEWDPALHQKAIDLINDGTIQFSLSAINKTVPDSVTLADLEGH